MVFEDEGWGFGCLAAVRRQMNSCTGAWGNVRRQSSGEVDRVQVETIFPDEKPSSC